MAKTEEEYFFEQRGFGKTLGLGDRPCLIVVDVINGFTDPAMPMGSDLSPQIEEMNKLLALFHRMNFPVIFTTIAYEDNSLLDSGIWLRKMEGMRTLKAGTAAVNLDARLEFHPRDTVLVKKYASAFFGTDLASRLTAGKIDTVVIVGCTTCGCVRASAVDALQYGFRPIVVEDAVGDRSEQSHTQSLFDLRQKYADVFMADEVAAQMAAKYSPSSEEEMAEGVRSRT